MPPFATETAATTETLLTRADDAAEELAELLARLAARADREEHDGGARW